jgi:hypothetical protein
MNALNFNHIVRKFTTCGLLMSVCVCVCVCICKYFINSFCLYCINNVKFIDYAVVLCNIQNVFEI